MILLESTHSVGVLLLFLFYGRVWGDEKGFLPLYINKKCLKDLREKEAEDLIA